MANRRESTRSRRDETDGFESLVGTQTACIHIQDVANKSNKPANTSVTADLPANGTEPCIGVPNGLESPADASDACTRMQWVADESREPTDDLEHVRRSQNGCKRSNLPAKPLRTRPEKPEKRGNRADASSGCTHMQSGRIDTKTTARMAEVISTTPNKQKPPNSPVGAGCWCRNGTNGLGNVVDASTTRTDMHSDQNGMTMTTKTRETVSKSSKKPKMPNSPIGPKIWRRGDGNGSGNHADGSTVCRDTQCAGTDAKTAENASKNVFVFGRFVEVLGSLEDVEATVEGETDGSRDDGCDGDVDGTASGGNVDSNRVEALWLTAESQQTRKNAKTQRNDLPVSPGQPAHSRIPCYGVPRMNRQCQRITFEPRNISQTRKVKITYLGHANAMWSMWRPGNRIRWLKNPVAECKSQGERRRSVEDYG